MALPFPLDPSDPARPNPYFQDDGFIRGDQARSNNHQTWENLKYVHDRIFTLAFEVGHVTNLNVSTFSGLLNMMDQGQIVEFLAGDRVASGFDMKVYVASLGAWTPLGIIPDYASFLIEDYFIYFSNDPEGNIDQLYNNSGVFSFLLDKHVSKLPVYLAEAAGITLF